MYKRIGLVTIAGIKAEVAKQLSVTLNKAVAMPDVATTL